MPGKILVVLTSHDQLGNTGKKTGWYLSEFAHPYDELAAAGYDVDVTSPKGGVAPLDPGSVELFKDDPSSKQFYATKKDLWEKTIPLDDVAGSDEAIEKTVAAYDGIFYPGGHGPLYDLATDERSLKLAGAFADADKPVGAVCHGPGALVNAKTKDGKALFAGKKVSGFSNEEEAAVGLTEVVPFLLEDRIKAAGAQYEGVPAFQVQAVVDGKLVTGQNPMSGKAVGEALVKVLGSK